VIQRKADQAARSDVIVIAPAKAKPGNGEELERVLRELTDPTRAQPGCALFSLYRSVDNPSIIIGFEHSVSRESHQRHLQGAHVKQLMSAMAELLAEPPQISSYETVDEK
jgi:quinol monooxygenase YgiN